MVSKSDLLLLRKNKWLSSTCYIFIMFASFFSAFILLHFEFFSDSVYPTRDSLNFHYNSYQFLLVSLWKESQIPTIFPAGGGVPYVLSAMSFGLLMPYKLLSLTLYPIFNDPVLLWKISIVIGYAYFTTGLFFVCRSISRNSLLSLLVCLFILQTGFSNSFHQEQVIYTVIHAPYLFLALVNFWNKPSNFNATLIGCVIGLMSFTHFPQIQVCIILGTFLFSRISIIQLLKDCGFFRICRHLFWIASGFLAFALPTIIFLIFYDEIILPERIFSGFKFVPTTVEILFSDQKLPGAEGLYFCGLAGFDRYSTSGLMKCFFELSFFGIETITKEHQIGIDDATILYVGPLFFIAFVVSAAISIKSAKKELAFIVLLMFLFVGPVGSAIGFPAKLASFGFGEFRQWYHFYPALLYFSLLLVVRALSIQRLDSGRYQNNEIIKIGLAALLPLTFFLKDDGTYMTTSADKPLPFAQHTNQPLWSNPNLVSFVSRKVICKESLFRHEPSSFVNDAALGFYFKEFNHDSVLTNTENGSCMSPNNLTSFRKETAGVLIRSDYAVADTGNRPVEISFINMEKKKGIPNALIDTAKISPMYGDLIFEGKIPPTISENQSIVVSNGKSHFKCKNYSMEDQKQQLKVTCVIPRTSLLNEQTTLGMFKILMIDGNRYFEIAKSKKIRERNNLVIEFVSHSYSNGSYKMKFIKPKQNVFLFLNSENGFEASPGVTILKNTIQEPTIKLVSKNGLFQEISIEVSPTIRYSSYLSFFIMIMTNILHFCALSLFNKQNDRQHLLASQTRAVKPKTL